MIYVSRHRINGRDLVITNICHGALVAITYVTVDYIFHSTDWLSRVVGPSLAYHKIVLILPWAIVAFGTISYSLGVAMQLSGRSLVSMTALFSAFLPITIVLFRRVIYGISDHNPASFGSTMLYIAIGTIAAWLTSMLNIGLLRLLAIRTTPPDAAPCVHCGHLIDPRASHLLCPECGKRWRPNASQSRRLWLLSVLAMPQPAARAVTLTWLAATATILLCAICYYNVFAIQKRLAHGGPNGSQIDGVQISCAFIGVDANGNPTGTSEEGLGIWVPYDGVFSGFGVVVLHPRNAKNRYDNIQLQLGFVRADGLIEQASPIIVSTFIKTSSDKITDGQVQAKVLDEFMTLAIARFNALPNMAVPQQVVVVDLGN